MTSRLSIVQPGANRRYKNVYPRVLRTVPRPSIVDYFTDYKPREAKRVQISFYMEPEEVSMEECGICLSNEVRSHRMVLLTDCGHSVCDECLHSMAETKTCSLVCPFCRDDIDNVEVQSGESFNTFKNCNKVFKTDLNYIV